MTKLFFLIIFLFAAMCPLKASEIPGDSDQEFIKELDKVKNPFEDGIPKPVIIAPVVKKDLKSKTVSKPKRKLVVEPEIRLPDLNLQGVIVGEGIYQAIINDQVVPLLGSIDEAQVISVTKEGVGLLFKGKKFFLKVD